MFSFAAMRLVGGLPHAVDPERRYWVHVILVFIQLFATVNVFWVFWSYRDVTWNLERFLLVLASPALIYFNRCVVIPEVPASVESWRSYYFSVCRRYFLGVFAWALAVIAASTFVLDMSLTDPLRAIQVVYVAVAVVGASSRSPRVHSGIAVFLLVLAGSLAVFLGSRPGPLAPH